MNSRIITLGILILAVAVAGFSLYRISSLNRSLDTATSSVSTGGVACTMEAKICPDGSAVGREGPNCEFAACPGVAATTTYQKGDTVTVTMHLGESRSALGETITVNKVLDDSRCPKDVQCIWAGTVHVQATVVSGMGNGAITFELGKTGTTEVNEYTLTDVSPAKDSQQEIAAAAYVFTFKVVRR